MKKFDQLLEEQLENLDTSEVKNQYEVIKEIHKDLAEAKGRVTELETQLSQAIDELNFQLGLSVRKQLPKLSVSLDGGKCNIAYRTRNLSLRPDLEQETWSLEPNEWGRRFKRINGGRFPLDDPSGLAGLIKDYYQGRYKTLR